ncbi:unnamed protein product [Ceratitis capitata]|uniref:(Mediterranean fruit fly) hypothetical protein n=1 Tax=Ceratitis capitata TaxID=7213 RepID=A0A811TXL8_CERCA|nr:unnamed protein product [Ceratitis capitata]
MLPLWLMLSVAVLCTLRLQHFYCCLFVSGFFFVSSSSVVFALLLYTHTHTHSYCTYICMPICFVFLLQFTILTFHIFSNISSSSLRMQHLQHLLLIYLGE